MQRSNEFIFKEGSRRAFYPPSAFGAAGSGLLIAQPAPGFIVNNNRRDPD